MAKRGESVIRPENHEEIKRRFVEGDDAVTQALLAKEYGLSVSTISNRACKGEWDRLRAEYRDKLQKAANAQSIALRAATLAKNADERLDKLQGLFNEGVERVRRADDGFHLQAAAVALGIIVDKIHKELEAQGVSAKGAPQATYTEEQYTRREWVLRNLQNGGDVEADE